MSATLRVIPDTSCGWSVVRDHADGARTTIGRRLPKGEAVRCAKLLAGWRGSVAVEKRTKS